ncbi:MAG: ATP-binding cassette domain-containing protein [Gammaproteobacteria bacterium]
MTIKSEFLKKLLSQVKENNQTNNLLIKCLNQIAYIMNFTLQWHYINDLEQVNLNNISFVEQSLEILFYRVSVSSMDNFSNLTAPVLFQLINDDNLYVAVKRYFGKLILYDAKNNFYKTIRVNENKLPIEKAWQCCPVHFPVSTRYKDLIKFILSHFKSSILISLIYGIAISITTLLISMISGYVFEHIHEVHQANFLIIYGAFFFLVLSNAAISYQNDLHIKMLNTKALFLILPSVWRRIFNLPIYSLRKFMSGDLVQIISDFEMTIATLIKSNIALLYCVMSLVLMFVYMVYCSTWIACLYLIVCILFFGIKLYILPVNIKYISAQVSEQGKLTSLLNESLLQIDKIRTSNSEIKVFNRWLEGLLKVKLYAEKYTKTEIILWALEAVIPLALLLLFYLMLYLTPKKPDNYYLLQFMICAGQFTGIFQKLSSELMTFIHLLPGLLRLQPLLSETSEIKTIQHTQFKFSGNICVSNLYLAYAGSRKWILEDISMQINQGEFIAIIGKSGAGKSSFLRVLIGLESESSGTILLDNINIQNLNFSQVRKQFGVVLQSTSILAGSIFSNISANKKLTMEDAWRLAKWVNLDNDINLMPMKMHTYISDNASDSISGGQKQKILLARALATNPSLLLLDEATSALNANSQAIIYTNLKKLNITRIVIAHRHSTIVDADKIYVFDQGKIIDSGTFQELFLHK